MRISFGDTSLGRIASTIITISDSTVIVTTRTCGCIVGPVYVRVTSSCRSISITIGTCYGRIASSNCSVAIGTRDSGVTSSNRTVSVYIRPSSIRIVHHVSIGTSYFISHRNSIVISIDIGPSHISTMSVGLSNTYITSSEIIAIRSIIGISNWCIESSIGSGVYITESNCRPNKEPMERTIHIPSIINVDESRMVAKHTSVIEYG